jgi:hypothetical protein
VRLDAPFVNGRGDRVAHASIRRVSVADATFAPILRDRVGEDVCSAPGPVAAMIDALARLFRGFWK